MMNRPPLQNVHGAKYSFWSPSFKMWFNTNKLYKHGARHRKAQMKFFSRRWARNKF